MALARARTRVPQAEFLLGDLHQFPVADAGVDMVVCALALTHLGTLKPVMAEFARVLRPGGHLVISDMHPETVALGSIPSIRGADGRPGHLSAYRHLIGDYLRAALAVGLRVRRCEEPSAPPKEPPGPADRKGPFGAVGPWERWPWRLDDIVPEAARVARAGMPALVIWHFQSAES